MAKEKMPIPFNQSVYDYLEYKLLDLEHIRNILMVSLMELAFVVFIITYSFLYKNSKKREDNKRISLKNSLL